MTDVSGEIGRTPFHTEDDEQDEPLTYEALLADRDGWKRIADERWQTIAHVSHFGRTVDLTPNHDSDKVQS
jgi:hypothetical protein